MRILRIEDHLRIFDHESDWLPGQLQYDGNVGRKREHEFLGSKSLLAENEGLAFEAFGIGFEQARWSVSFQNELGRRAQDKWECKIIVAFCVHQKLLRLTEDTWRW